MPAFLGTSPNFCQFFRKKRLCGRRIECRITTRLASTQRRQQHQDFLILAQNLLTQRRWCDFADLIEEPSDVFGRQLLVILRQRRRH